MLSKIYKNDYIVYENGSVYSLKRKVFLKEHLNKNGYIQVMIKSKREYLHRVVAISFYGDSNLTVDHIDGNKHNNELSNLEFVTQSENNKRYREKTNDANRIKATKSRSNSVLWNGKKFESQRSFAEYAGISSGFVTTLIRNNRMFKGSYVESQENKWL